ncbi:hypothetical protein AFGD_009429 [Aspergillus flavus]|nr:hypothetical protein AFGD_009429 [Aspergillus flavus]
MTCRGVWNLRVKGKWYRYGDSAWLITPPGHISTLRKLNQLLGNPDNIKGWKKVTSPTLDLSDMDFIYTLDTETGTFKISQGKRFTRPLFPVPTDTYLKPATLREGHDIGIRFTDLGYSHLVPHKYTRVDELDPQRLNLKRLQLEFGIPTAMNELQERIFTDFSSDGIVLEQWQYPKTEVFWFHRFLVVIQEDILLVSMKSIAILKARIYRDHNGANGHVPRLILLSPIHVAFVELRKDGDWCSKSLLLVTSSSAAWCSPGFRALSRVLSSNYQTPIGDTAAQFEKWRVALPFEILHMILKLCEPRDAVSFTQASVAVEKCYYTSIPQFEGLATSEDFAALNVMLGSISHASVCYIGRLMCNTSVPSAKRKNRAIVWFF